MNNPFASWKRLQRFSIRKLTIGVVSATIGMALLGTIATSQPTLAQERISQSVQTVKIDYHYVAYDSLTAQEQATLKPGGDLTKELALADAQYVLVYRQDAPAAALPQTGDLSGALLTLLGATGALAVVISLVRRDRKTLVKVVIVTALGTASLNSSAIGALDHSLRTFLTTTHLVALGDHLPAPQALAGRRLYGFQLASRAADSATPMAEQDKAAPAEGNQDQGAGVEATKPKAPQPLASTDQPSSAIPVDPEGKLAPTQPTNLSEPSRPPVEPQAPVPGKPSQPTEVVVEGSNPIVSVIETKLELVPFEVTVTWDDSLPLGTEFEVQPGVNGIKTVNYLNGNPVSSLVTIPAVKQIIRRGTKVVPPAQPVETTGTESIAFTTEVISDDTLPLGEEVLVQAGVAGVLTHTYLDGQLVSSQITTPAVNQIVRRGTKVVVPAQPVETTSTESIAFTTEVISDDTLPLGEEVLVQAGVAGLLTHTYLDGQLVSSQVTTPAVNQIIRRGTKVVASAQPVETTSTESIPFTTEVISDDTLPLGEEVLVQAGVAGVLTHTYLDGQLVSSQVTTPAVNQIIRRGTKVVASAQPVETTSTESIAFTTEVISDDTLPLGEEVLVQAGVAGVLTHTYLDGQLVSSQVTTPAVNQIIRRGTKVVAPTQPVETTSTESIAFTTEVISDDTLPLGEEVLVQAGVAGVLTHTYLDGQLVSSQVTTPAVKQIIRRGTKVVEAVLGTETDRQEVSLPYRVREEKDDQLWEDERQEIQEGRNGLKEIVTTYQTIDGQRQPNPTVTERELQAPQDRIVRVGTRPVEGSEPVVTYEDVRLDKEVRPNPEAWLGESSILEEGAIGQNKIITVYKTVRGVRTEEVLNRQVVSVRPAVGRIEMVGTKPLEGQTVETSEEVVEFETIYRTNPDLPVGETRVVSKGHNGLIIVTETYRTVRGEKVGQPEINREERVAVQHEVIERGSKVLTPDQPVHGTEMERREVPLPYKVREEKDETLWEGERQEVQAGRNGLKEIVTTYQTIDGQRQPNSTVTERELQAPQDRVVKVGTKPIDGRESVVSYEPISNRTETRQNANSWAGDERIIEQGSAGQNKVTTIYKTVRGVRTTEVLDRQVEEVRPAVNRIVEIGTKPIMGRDTVREVVTIAPQVSRNQDASIWAGDIVVDNPGQAGEKAVIKVYETERGQRTGKILEDREEPIRSAIDRIERIGTKPIVGQVVETSEEVVKFTSTTRDNPDLPEGQTRTVTVGRDGVTEVTKTYRTERGVKVGEPTIARQVKVAVQNEVIERGTKPVEGRELVVTYEDVRLDKEVRPNPEAWLGEISVLEEGRVGQNKITTVYKTIRGVRTTEVLERQVEQVRPAVRRVELIGTKPIVGQVVETSEEVVKFTSTTRDNPDLPEGQTRTVTVGRDGVTEVTKTYRTERGVKVGEPTIARQVKVAVQNEVIERGTKPVEGSEPVVTYEDVRLDKEVRPNPDAWLGEISVLEEGRVGQNKITTVYKTVRGVRTTEVLERQVEQVRPAVRRVELIGTKPIVGQVVETSEEVVKFTSTTRDNSDLPEGQTRTVTAGRDGVTEVTKTYRTERGVKVGEPTIARRVKVAVQNEVIERGTKPVLAPVLVFNPITQDNVVNASESQSLVRVTGRLRNGLADDKVTVVLGGVSHQAQLTGEEFSIDLSGQALAEERTISATLSRQDKVLHQITHRYNVVTALDQPVITLDKVTKDNIVNLKESQNGIVISGLVDKAKDGEEVLISCGCPTCQGAVQWVDVTTRVENGGFNVTLPGDVVAAGNVIKARLTTTDAYGNTSTGRAERLYEVDVTPPQPSLTFNAIDGDNMINQASPDQVTISGNIINLGADERAVLTARIGDSLHHVEVTGHSYQLTLPKASFGQAEAVRLSLTVTDRAGNETSLADQVQTYTYDVSLAAPAIALNQVPTVTSQTKQVVLSGGLSHDEDVTQANVRVIYRGQSHDVRLTNGRWELTLPADQVTHTQGNQSYRVEAEVTDRVGNTARHQVTGNFTVASSLPVVTVELLPLAPVERTGSELVTVTGRVSGHRAGNKVFVSLGQETLSSEPTADGQFQVQFKRSDLVANASHRLEARFSTADQYGNIGQAQTSLTYELAKTSAVESLTLESITADDHINVTEAQTDRLTLSGQAEGTGPVTVTIGDKVETAQVRDGRYSLSVATRDLVTNGSYRVTVSQGNQTIHRPYTVAAGGTSQIAVTTIGEGFDLNPVSDTVRISGTLRLDGLEAKYHNDLFIDTVKVTLNNKVYTAGLGKARARKERIRGWLEDVKEKDFSFDIPVAELREAVGKDLVFALPDDHHLIYEARRGNSDDVPQTINTRKPSVTDQSKYTLQANPWLVNGTGKTITLPAADKLLVSGRVGGHAKPDDVVEVRIGNQVYRGQVDSGESFSVLVDRAAITSGTETTLAATLISKDYAGQQIRVTDTVTYRGRLAEQDGRFVTTFDTSHKDNIPYFLDAIRHFTYNSTGHLARHQIGQDNYHLTYHFRGQDTVSFSEDQRAMIRKVLDEIASHTRLTFTEKETVGVGNTADINFYLLNRGGRSHAFFGGSVDFTALPTSEALYNHTYTVALHEVLHSLGARHPHEADQPLGNEDSLLTSIMSYNLDMGQPVINPLRVLDQIYLHYRYGVNESKRSGNNTYTFKRTSSYTLDKDSYIWDGAGVDTFDASMEDKKVVVDLTPGSWIYRGDKTSKFWADETKDFHKNSGHFFNAPHAKYDDTLIPDAMVYNEDQAFIGYGTQIERLIGSKHDDVLRGNVAANDILGGAGADQIWGDAGDDYLDGGAGADQMDGGAGNDTFIVDNEGDRVTESSGQGQDLVISSVNFDLPEHVEDLTLTGTAVTGRGNAGNNRITGNSVANTLTGGGGADTFVFNSPLNGNVDVIEDFGADDVIELSADIFTGVDSTRPFERIKYDQTSGVLSYLPDTPGHIDPITFAKLTPGFALQASQVRVAGASSQTPPPPRQP